MTALIDVPRYWMLWKRLLARCLELGRLHLARLVAERIPDVGRDRREFDIGERLPGRHRILAAEHDLDLVRLVRDYRASRQRGEGPRHALTVRLVAGLAVRLVDLLAACNQLLLCPCLQRIVLQSRQLLLLAFDPLRVVLG